jgi:hypothetical protein
MHSSNRIGHPSLGALTFGDKTAVLCERDQERNRFKRKPLLKNANGKIDYAKSA